MSAHRAHQTYTLIVGITHSANHEEKQACGSAGLTEFLVFSERLWKSTRFYCPRNVVKFKGLYKVYILVIIKEL